MSDSRSIVRCRTVFFNVTDCSLVTITLSSSTHPLTHSIWENWTVVLLHSRVMLMLGTWPSRSAAGISAVRAKCLASCCRHPGVSFLCSPYMSMNGQHRKWLVGLYVAQAGIPVSSCLEAGQRRAESWRKRVSRRGLAIQVGHRR